MIDFPASPTDGQSFSAPNGVVYKYSATYSSWLAQNAAPAIGGVGEVMARQAGAWTIPVAGSYTQVPFDTVMSGNAGLWWNTTTNRYTPPAGKYFLAGTLNIQAPSGGNGTGSFILRKNGVNIPGTGTAGSGGALFSIALTASAYVDANGTDYFDWATNVTSGCVWAGSSFAVFPLTGIQGPTGGAPGPVVGDFFAANNTPFTMATVETVVVPPLIVTGNSGSYYSTATGRYTPPAGRYLIFATSVTGWSGGPILTELRLRKNGAMVERSVETPGNSTYYNTNKVAAIVDANGTDYFELSLWGNSAGGACSNLYFGATPTQGMVGPQGPAGPLPAGALSLYQEVLLAANAANMQVSWPSGVRKIEIEYYAINNGGVGDTLSLRAMLNGVPNTANSYATQFLYGSASTPAAGILNPSTLWQALGGMTVTKGTFKPAVTALQSFVEHAQVGTSVSAGYALVALHWGTPGANMNGLQLFNASGTLFLPGSFLRVYVVP